MKAGIRVKDDEGRARVVRTRVAWERNGGVGGRKMKRDK